MNFKKILKVVLLITITTAFFACKPAAKKANHIVVGTDATWPPMEMVNEKKEIVGFDIDFINAVAKEVGLTVEFKNSNWDGLFAGLATKKYDIIISAVTITEKRKEMMDFSIPYLNAGQVLVVQAKDNNITKLSDLAGKQVGAQIGTTGAFQIKKVKSLKLKSYDEIGFAIEDLANGRIAGVVADTPTAANYALQNDKYKNKLIIATQPLNNESFGIALAKGNNELLEKINRGIKQVQAKGIDKELKKKWLQ